MISFGVVSGVGSAIGILGNWYATHSLNVPSDGGGMTVAHALGDGGGGPCVKEPKTSDSPRTIPPTVHTSNTLRLVRAGTVRRCEPR